MALRNAKPASMANPNAGMRMSTNGLAAMRNTEKVVLKYYNDMGKIKETALGG
jgi:hypothetical protein